MRNIGVCCLDNDTRCAGGDSPAGGFCAPLPGAKAVSRVWGTPQTDREERHNSCLLTSRENQKNGSSWLAKPTRAPLQMRGFATSRRTEKFSRVLGSNIEWKLLIEHYAKSLAFKDGRSSYSRLV